MGHLVKRTARDAQVQCCFFKSQHLLVIRKDVFESIDSLFQLSHLLDQVLGLSDIADRVHISRCCAIGQMAFVSAFMLTKQERIERFLPTHRYTWLLWHVCFDIMPLDITGYGFCLNMVVHETTNVRECIDILATELAVAKQSVLVP